MGLCRNPASVTRQAQRWVLASELTVHHFLRPFDVPPGVLPSVRTQLLHGDPVARGVVDSHLLRGTNASMEHRRRGTMVARLRPAAPGIGIRESHLPCSWNFVVSLPSF